jgi:hypothetical protein
VKYEGKVKNSKLGFIRKNPSMKAETLTIHPRELAREPPLLRERTSGQHSEPLKIEPIQAVIAE